MRTAEDDFDYARGLIDEHPAMRHWRKCVYLGENL